MSDPKTERKIERILTGFREGRILFSTALERILKLIEEAKDEK
jgi:hypothetical protein